MARVVSLLPLGMLGFVKKGRPRADATRHMLINPSDKVLPQQTAEHLIRRDDRYFAGTHLIIDLWQAQRLDDLEHIRTTMLQAVQAAKATLLHSHLHYFTPNAGVSGVAVLAESHMSIHTWPEYSYAALDIFMCGNSQPECTVPIWQQALNVRRMQVDIIHRGELTPINQGAPG